MQKFGFENFYTGSYRIPLPLYIPKLTFQTLSVRHRKKCSIRHCSRRRVHVRRVGGTGSGLGGGCQPNKAARPTNYDAWNHSQQRRREFYYSRQSRRRIQTGTTAIPVRKRRISTLGTLDHAHSRTKHRSNIQGEFIIIISHRIAFLSFGTCRFEMRYCSKRSIVASFRFASEIMLTPITDSHVTLIGGKRDVQTNAKGGQVHARQHG